MERNTFRREWVRITYSCHSAARREQFSTREAEMRSLEGREANRIIMHNASSMSRTASVKVGYLRKIDHRWVFRLGKTTESHLSLIMWSRRYTGLLSSRLLALLHSPLPNARASFLAKALCSRSFFRTGSCARYAMSFA